MRLLSIDGELTISRAAELKGQILAALSDPGPLQLDLGAVTDIDTAGVQLLLLAREHAARRGRELSWGPPSAVVDEAFRLLRLPRVHA